MCHIQRTGFVRETTDNDEMIFQHLSAVVDSVDEYAYLQITKDPSKFNFRVSPSLPRYNNMLLQEILKLCNIFKIRLDLSKSIKSSGSINFSIHLS